MTKQYTQLVDYKLSESSLISLEFAVQERFRKLLGVLKDIFIDENMVQLPQFLISHMVAYVGFFSTIVMKHDIPEKKMIQILKEHSYFAYDKCKRYIPTKDIDRLKKSSPGSIATQTVRLGRVMYDLMLDLPKTRIKRHEKSKFFIDSFFGPDIVELCNDEIGFWEEEGQPILCVINQMLLQIAWLIGYWCYVDNANPKEYLQIITLTMSTFIRKTLELIERDS